MQKATKCQRRPMKLIDLQGELMEAAIDELRKKQMSMKTNATTLQL